MLEKGTNHKDDIIKKNKIIFIVIIALITIDYFGLNFQIYLPKFIFSWVVVLLYLLLYAKKKIGKFNSQPQLIMLIAGPTSWVLFYIGGILNRFLGHGYIVPLFILMALCIDATISVYNDDSKVVRSIMSLPFPFYFGLLYSVLKLGMILSPVLYNWVYFSSKTLTFFTSFGLARMGDSLSMYIVFVSILASVLIAAYNLYRDISKTILLFLLIISMFCVHTITLSLILANPLIYGSTFIPFFSIILCCFFMIPSPFSNLFGDCLSMGYVGRNDRTPSKLKHNWVFYSLIMLFSLLFLNIPAHMPKSGVHKTVTIIGGVEAQASLTTRPSFDSELLGFSYTNALYGSLPLYLRASGFTVNIADTLESIDYTSTEIIILIMYNKDSENFPATERMSEFVRDGGRLIVFADHTNIMDVMSASNPLISFANLRINDDTSDDILHHQGYVWNNNLYSHFQPLFTRDIKQDEIQVWGGASVEATGYRLLIEPVIIGRYATSDPADPTNTGVGGLLGNRRFDFGEPIGDIVLAAQSSYGKGSVLVFGDTSYIQTPVLSSNWKYISALIHGDYSQSNILIIIKTVMLIAMLLGIIYLGVFRKYLEPKVKGSGEVVSASQIFTLCVMMLFIFIFVAVSINDSVSKEIYKTLNKNLDTSFAYVNNAYANQISLSLTDKNSIVGLTYNALKNEVPMVVGNDLKGKAVFIIHPNRSIPARDQDRILNYIKNGGIVVFAIGKDFASGKIFDELGLELKSKLGPVPWRYPNIPETMLIDFPDFKQAWEINITKSDITSSWLQYEDYTLISKSKYGNGICYVIADEEFFVIDNIEGETSGNSYNIALLKRLFDEINSHQESKER
ncbi:MAG: hypothetical protein LBR68_05175 [Lachnoclostridium sp.]|jgi:hypothetical protein|nr:hypothetical protein [Lachnoclostridium sp.]